MRPVRRIAGTVAGVVALAGVAVLGVGMLPRPRPTPPPLPSPNGYDDLVRAGTMIVGKEPEVGKAGKVELRAFVEPNAPALALARQGLNRDCRVPLAFTTEWLSASIQAAANIRRVARLLIAAGALAETEGRVDEALRCYQDAVYLGPQSSRGGLMVHALVGLSVQQQGLDRLEGIRESLDAGQCRHLIDNLGAREGSTDSPASVIARDRAWSRAAADWQARAALLLAPRALESMRKPADQALERAGHRVLRKMRLVRVLTAVRLYKLEHGGIEPPGLTALVPRFLQAVPRDPSTGQIYLYRDEPGEGIRIGPVGTEPSPSGSGADAEAGETPDRRPGSME